LNSILIASLTLGAMGVTDCQAKGNYNSAAADLMGAFQTGCSLNGNYLQLALNQTQYFAQTAQDLGKNASCAGVNGALSTIQNLQTQISSINNNSYASQISNLSTIQSGLMLQISQATDPATLATLSTTYSNNLLSLGEAEYYAGTSGSGAAAMTSLQTGSTQVNGYLTQLLSDQTNITQCAADNPALAAQLGAGMIAVAGSFTPSVAGTALTLAGNAINTAIGFIQARQFSKQVDKLNQVQMTKRALTILRHQAVRHKPFPRRRLKLLRSGKVLKVSNTNFLRFNFGSIKLLPESLRPIPTPRRT
jgi:hypothetical protein